MPSCFILMSGRFAPLFHNTKSNLRLEFVIFENLLSNRQYNTDIYFLINNLSLNLSNNQ